MVESVEIPAVGEQRPMVRKTRRREPATPVSKEMLRLHDAAALRNANEIALSAGLTAPHGWPVVWQGNTNVFVFILSEIKAARVVLARRITTKF